VDLSGCLETVIEACSASTTEEFNQLIENTSPNEDTTDYETGRDLALWSISFLPRYIEGMCDQGKFSMHQLKVFGNETSIVAIQLSYKTIH